MGHWDTCPLDFQLFIFSGHFRAAQTLTFDSMWWPTQKEYTGLSETETETYKLYSRVS